jgi:hypothetical protein
LEKEKKVKKVKQKAQLWKVSSQKIRKNSIVFPFIIWFYGSAIVIIRGWGCGFGDSEDIVTWSDNRASFTVLGFMAVVAYCRGI